MMLNESTPARSTGIKRFPGAMLRSFPVLMLIAVAAAGCANRYELEYERKLIESQNVKPENFKPDLLAFLRTYLNNPEGVRDAALSEPQKLMLDTERYAACLRYNSKNSAGRYTGLNNHLAVFISGKFDQLVELGPVTRGAGEGALQPLREYCNKASYQPFPELQQLRR
jgi:hypothetical protein